MFIALEFSMSVLQCEDMFIALEFSMSVLH